MTSTRNMAPLKNVRIGGQGGKVYANGTYLGEITGFEAGFYEEDVPIPAAFRAREPERAEYAWKPAGPGGDPVAAARAAIVDQRARQAEEDRRARAGGFLSNGPRSGTMEITMVDSTWEESVFNWLSGKREQQAPTFRIGQYGGTYSITRESLTGWRRWVWNGARPLVNWVINLRMP